MFATTICNYTRNLNVETGMAEAEKNIQFFA